MTILEQFSHFFKPDVRKAGDDLLKRKVVFLQIGSDTQIDASVRGTTLSRVSFRTDAIESETFKVDCTCKASKKGQFCKHVWAVLEMSSEKSPDFFESKTELEKAELVVEPASKAGSPVRATQTNFKEKQDEYRKRAYETQKQRAKDFKANRSSQARAESIKTSAFLQALPDEVKSALAYFEVNGFPMTLPVDDITLATAKRVLSRVFHPDKGGTHDEMLELLRHSSCLIKFRL